jgi:hypothetical protein
MAGNRKLVWLFPDAGGAQKLTDGDDRMISDGGRPLAKSVFLTAAFKGGIRYSVRVLIVQSFVTSVSVQE